MSRQKASISSWILYLLSCSILAIFTPLHHPFWMRVIEISILATVYVFGYDYLVSWLSKEKSK